ncbi:MAG: N-acetylneuraminate synthase, partial [Ferrovum sp.]|nr:N-acetylneuraminate synthase [Ferrovum sp.]
MQIKDTFIGSGNRPFIIAEVAQSHEGSLGLAFSFIDVAKECGADAIKFQTHIASEESTPAEPWRVRFSRQDASRYDYWKRMEFTLDQWHELKVYADSRDIVFLSSPFSVQACQWLEEIGMPAWKIASGEVHNTQVLQ